MSTRAVGSVIGLKPEFPAQYVALHANVFPGVLARIRQSHIRNYTIFLHDGLLFSHFEYTGTDFDADMAAMATDETTRQWWTLTDQMQQPCDWRAAGEWWATLAELEGFAAGRADGRIGVQPWAPEGERTAVRLAFVAPRSGAVAAGRSPASASIPGVIGARAFVSPTRVFVYCEAEPDTAADAVATGLQWAFGLDTPPAQMTAVFHTEGAARGRVFVSGCFDMLHSGHVAFFREAASYGDLYVGLGSDATIFQLKGRRTINSQAERKYMIDALDCVTECRVNTGSGILDFEPDLDDIRPDILIVNEDGHTPAKEALCRERGIEYVKLRRVPHAGLPPRSTTTLRAESLIPFRIDLAGGWLDQPYVSTCCPGSVLTISIEPTVEFNDRSGMASSTRRKAIALWHNALPHGDPQLLAKVLFSFENPPGTKEVAGSQDALGIVLPGLNRLHYERGEYWPSRIEPVHDEAILSWLERRMFLLTLGPRVSTFRVLDETRIDEAGAQALAAAADACWDAILARDTAAFGAAFRRSFEAQVAMFPKMVDDGIREMIEKYRDRALGWKLSGAGGGGYLILVSDEPLNEGITVRIRRRDSL